MLTEELLVPTFTQMLRTLSGWLDKAADGAATRGDDADAFTALRLAPDMFPLGSQVRFACFQALESVRRLHGDEVPDSASELRAEGWSATQGPGSLGQARARIAETLTFLERSELGRRDDQASIALELPNGMIFDMVTAYAVLRSHGVELGKADLVPHMIGHLRAGMSPAR